MWVCALVCWEIHGLLATGPAKPEVEKQQQQQRQKLRQQQQPTPIGRKQNMARRQGAATHCQKFLPHLVGMGVAQFLPRTWPLLAPPATANPFFFWQSASSSSFLAGVVEFLVLALAFHVCQTELWLVNIFVHSGRKKDSTGTTKQSNERNQKSSKQTMATNFVNLHKQLGVPIPLKGICNINFPCSQ